jgi:2-polyprenyl-6-hydroxyphenyl methylase/3-demethylubiquinone-9 3-methyltransferase
MVKKDGMMIFSTINRTPKSFALAIVGAEYVLRWVPTGTHSYEKFLKPSEVDRAFRATGFAMEDLTGYGYRPLSDSWAIISDVSVNYIGTARPV